MRVQGMTKVVKDCIDRGILEVEIAREELFRHEEPGSEEAIHSINTALRMLSTALHDLQDSGYREERMQRFKQSP